MIRSTTVPLRLLGVFLLAFVITGCQTTDYDGTGELNLRSGLTKYVEKYLSEPNPMALAISVDGRCARYRYCPTHVGSCLTEDAKHFAIKGCESLCKRDCKVLMLRKTVVWNGPIKGLPETVQRPQDKALEVAASQPGLFKVPVWEAKRCSDGAATMFDRKAGPAFRDCPDCPEMVTLPAGTYWVGSTESTNEVPLHEVTFAKPFAVGKYEVTFDQWDACVAGGGCTFKPAKDDGWGRGNQPVINVSWQQADSYAKWLSKKTGATYRLLTEAEWEYAARAGSCSKYWWGQAVGAGHAVCKNCGTQWDGKKPAPVGQLKANAFGLHDMAGNVSEWIADCKSAYTDAPRDGSVIADGVCNVRGNRGGSWNRDVSHTRPEFRTYDSWTYANNMTGFRIAKTLP